VTNIYKKILHERLVIKKPICEWAQTATICKEFMYIIQWMRKQMMKQHMNNSGLCHFRDVQKKCKPEASNYQIVHNEAEK
jgi:D-mannonate dehydratase